MQNGGCTGNLLLDSFENAIDFTNHEAREHEILIEADKPSEFVYFPHRGCVVSLTRSIESGDSVEVAIVGFEGVVNSQIILAGAPLGLESVTQVSGTLSRVHTADLRALMHRDAGIRELLLLCAATLLAQVSQHTLCNRLHTTEQRLAKWLLGVRDRINSDTIELTHDFISQMMGIRRAGVTVAIGNLSFGGVITHARSAVTIIDRERLELRACECYAAIVADSVLFLDRLKSAAVRN